VWAVWRGRERARRGQMCEGLWLAPARVLARSSKGRLEALVCYDERRLAAASALGGSGQPSDLTAGSMPQFANWTPLSASLVSGARLLVWPLRPWVSRASPIRAAAAGVERAGEQSL
jgi:hypothetical protein